MGRIVVNVVCFNKGEMTVNGNDQLIVGEKDTPKRL